MNSPGLESATPIGGKRRRSKRYAHLDGLRALAVLAILIRHAWGLSGSPRIPILGHDASPFVDMLSSGIDLFFVLSGFLLSQSYLRNRLAGRSPQRYRTYWGARVLRIGPPYWLALVLVVLLMTPAFIPPERVFSKNGAVIFGAHLLFLQTAYLPSFGAYLVATPFWTLTIEMLFYATLPLIVRGFYGRRWVVTIPTMAAIAVGWLYYVRNHGHWLISFVNDDINIFPRFSEQSVRFFLSHQFPAFLVDFALGIAVAAVFTARGHAPANATWFRRLTGAKVAMAAFLLGSAVVLVAMWHLGRLSITYGYANPINYFLQSRGTDLTYYYLETIPFGVGFSLMLYGLVMGPRLLQRVFALRPLAFVGLIGYSVYLLHMPLLWAFNTYPWLSTDHDPASHFVRLLSFGGLAILAISTIYFYAIERPAMRASQALASRPDTPRVDAGGVGGAGDRSKDEQDTPASEPIRL